MIAHWTPESYQEGQIWVCLNDKGHVTPKKSKYCNDIYDCPQCPGYLQEYNVMLGTQYFL